MLRRAFDIAGSAVALLLLAPVLLLIACAVVLASGSPFLFSQIRIGRHFRGFSIYKFRTMRANALGLPLTTSADERITPIGRFLRATKLDELPQLANILIGDMSFVGPRPEIPEFVDAGDLSWREILKVRPGLVDPASLRFAREEALLARYPNPIAAYRNAVLPQKLADSRHYLATRTALTDLRLLARTFTIALQSWKNARD